MNYNVNESGEIIRNQPNSNNSGGWVSFFVIAFIITSIIAYIQYQDKEEYMNLYYSKENENQTLKTNLNNIKQSNSSISERINKLKNNYSLLNSDYNSLMDKYKPLQKYYPILIESVDFKSEKYPNSFKTRFSQYDVTYLYPRIKFTNLTTTDKLVLYVKYYSPNGVLATHSKSPYGYTQKVEITMNKSYDSYILTGFGNKNGGAFEVGKNICQIWYNDRILFEKKFNVY